MANTADVKLDTRELVRAIKDLERAVERNTKERERQNRLKQEELHRIATRNRLAFIKEIYGEASEQYKAALQEVQARDYT